MIKHNKVVIILLFLIATLSVSAGVPQSKKSVQLELFGASNLVGLTYEQRFSANNKWGYGIGLAFAYSKSSSFIFDYSSSTTGYAVPLQINYLLGKHNHKLELGMGTSLGYYRARTTETVFNLEDKGELIELVPVDVKDVNENTFGYFMFGNIGYRYISKKGFIFRGGISPSFNFGDKYGISKGLFYPYIGLGYAF